MRRNLKLHFLSVLSALLIFESQRYIQKYVLREGNHNLSIPKRKIGTRLSKRSIFDFFNRAYGTLLGDMQDDLLDTSIGNIPSSHFINSSSCPSILNAFFDRQKTKCRSLQSPSDWIRVAPVQGFGNQLNGVLQGLFSAAIFQKCLHIDWKFDELVGSNFRSRTFVTIGKRSSKACSNQP